MALDKPRFTLYTGEDGKITQEEFFYDMGAVEPVVVWSSLKRGDILIHRFPQSLENARAFPTFPPPRARLCSLKEKGIIAKANFYRVAAGTLLRQTVD